MLLVYSDDSVSCCAGSDRRAGEVYPEKLCAWIILRATVQRPLLLFCELPGWEAVAGWGENHGCAGSVFTANYRHD